MIKSQLIKREDVFGFDCAVELVANVDESELQLAQYRFELVAIYQSLAKKFSLDDAVEIITASVETFLKSHK